MPVQTHRHGEMQFVKHSRFAWPIVALIVAGALLLAILLRPSRQLKTAPPDTAVSLQPSRDQVQFENIQVVPSPAAGGAAATKVVIQADLKNDADIPINALQVEGVFMDENGQAIHRDVQPVMALKRLTRGKRVKEVSLDDSPVPRRDVRSIRITFSAVPPTWNKRDPQLNVKEVTSKPLAKPSAGQP